MTHLRKQFFGTLVSNVGIMLLSFVTGVITARALNPSGRGATAALMIWAQTLGWLFALGFAEASTYLQSTQPKNGKRLVGTALTVTIVLGALGTVFAERILPYVLHAQDEQTILIGRWFMATITLVIAVETLKGILAGDQDITFLNGMRVMQPLLYASALITLFFLHSATVSHVLICAAGSGLLLAIASFVRILARIGIGAPSLEVLRAGLAYGIRVHPGNFSDIANRRVDQLVMTAFFASTQIGFYAVATNISQMSVMILGNLCVVVFPAAARIGGAQGMGVVSRSIRIVTLLGVGLTALLMLIGPELIRIVYGRAYEGAVVPLEILLPGGAVLAIASIAASGLQSVNRPFDASKAQMAGAVITAIGISLRYWLHRYTIANAAITSTLAYCVTCALALLMLSRSPEFSLAETFAWENMMKEAARLWNLTMDGLAGLGLPRRHPNTVAPRAQTQPTTALATVLIACGVAVAILFSNALPLGGYQIAILLLAAAPAVFLAVTDSSYLLPYVLLAWVAGPEVRRIFEWSADHYQEVSPLSIIPLLVSASLLIPILRSSARLAPRLQLALRLLAAALAYAALVGMLRNGFALLFDAANYVFPILIVVYAATRPTRDSERDLWARSLVGIAIAAAIYGWVQFTLMPGWDAYWMYNEHIDSIGKPEPLLVRVYSTLNSPGPAGQFFAAALAAMLVNRRWRGPLGWLGIALVGSVLALTLVRTSWLTIIVFVVAYALFSGGRALKPLLVGVGVLVAALYFALPYLPGGDTIQARAGSFTDLNADWSFNDRAQFTHRAIGEYLASPLGTGLGSTGVGTRLDNGGDIGQNGVFDNGFIAILLTFGTPGFLALCGFFYNIARYLWAERVASAASMTYAGVGLAALAGAFAGLFSGNCLTGATAVFIWIFVAMGVGNKAAAVDARIPQSRELGAEKRLRNLAPMDY